MLHAHGTFMHGSGILDSNDADSCFTNLVCNIPSASIRAAKHSKKKECSQKKKKIESLALIRRKGQVDVGSISKKGRLQEKQLTNKSVP
jgi:hypothetical protein